MAKINEQLLQRLASHLGVKKGRVYQLIAQKATATGHDRHLAALLVAADKGINYQKYSTPEQRAQIRAALGNAGGPIAPPATEGVTQPGRHTPKAKKTPRERRPRDNSVFVVHGRNEELRKALFDFLRALGLKPLEWERVLQLAKGNNPFIGDVLDEVMGKVQAVLVLFSPDDEARLKPEFQTRADPGSEKKLMGQPRPNVLFEAGLALGRRPEKTVLVEIGKLRKFSDIGGRHVVRLTNDYKRRNDLANRLEKIGCKVDRTGTDWTKTGDFKA